jgi:hypothetical protein
MNLHRKALVGLAAGILLLPAIAAASPLHLAVDMQAKGLTMASAGVGTIGLGAGSRNLTVNIQGTVVFARLYWAGRQAPCDEDGGGNCAATFTPYRDQQMMFNGNPVTGTIIGSEGQPISGSGPILDIGYYADVTRYVAAAGNGTHTFTFSDGDIANNLWRLDGAGLIVGYLDPADLNTYRAIIWDGLDFAYGKDPVAGDTQTTDPVVINHGINMSPRTADLIIFSGDNVANRPDRIDISNNASLYETLDASQGQMYDADIHPINIPAGVGTTTVQIFSAPVQNANPDSILWQVAALRVQQLDTGKPICKLTATRTGPPAQIDITVQDTDTGLASIVVTKSNNADTPVPPFTVGDTSPIVITSTKIDQSQRAQVELQVSDLAGNTTVCDPILGLVTRAEGKVEAQTIPGVDGSEHVITLFNGNPGIGDLEIQVNNRKFKMSALSNGAKQSIDVGSAMVSGAGNTITLRAKGHPGGAANFMIWDGNQ